MGRYAQARRRGSEAPAPALVGPPPPPDITDLAGDLVVTPTGADDTGGRLEIWFAESEEGPYAYYDAADWASPVDFGGVQQFPNGYMKALELGNGTAYAGYSTLSAVAISVGP